MQTAKHWSLAAQWPPSPCCPAAATHARVAVSRPLIARQLRTGSSRHGGMGDFVHAAVTCYILINSPAGKKYKSNHVCNNFSFFIHRETMERLYIHTAHQIGAPQFQLQKILFGTRQKCRDGQQTLISCTLFQILHLQLAVLFQTKSSMSTFSVSGPKILSHIMPHSADDETVILYFFIHSFYF